jgi:nucleoside-diphosphate-sugar epimerase
MRFSDVTDANSLNAFMTEPTPGLSATLAAIDGEILVIGGSGKMGPELVEMLLRADPTPRVVVASRFSGDRGAESAARLETLGARVLRGDLTDPDFQAALPDAENLIYMVGFKFGSADDPGRSIQMNCMLPAQIAMAHPASRIVVFSSTNPCPLTRPEAGGAVETDELCPQGVYGWSILGRETAFRAVASGHCDLRICFYRLAYAQHLAYGVLPDLARMVAAGSPISLRMPYVNVISQRDANERALRCLELCANPAVSLNVNGPIARVRDLAEGLGELLGKAPVFADEEPELARVTSDALSVARFGPYRDSVEEMVEAAARWVGAGGENWEKPTMFGVADGQY